MFPDWVTISYGSLERLCASAIFFEKVRRVQALYTHVFSRTTFGSFSLCFPGQHWQSVRELAGFDLIDDCLTWAQGAHVTRFDLAHDWLNDDIDRHALWKAVVASGHKIEKLIGESGNTFYIEDRESDYFARLYNKTAEIRARTGVDINFGVTRFEAELKGEAAPQFFAHWRRSPADIQNTIAVRYNLQDFLIGSSTEIIRVMGLPAADPFAFVRKFWRCISYARALDPKLFDEIIAPGAFDTAVPPVTP